ncbi:MAG: hypothetical protein GX417_01350 [Clostridiales bacterium]|nr:hypothetical protein [Clostridiales bacterium]
MNVSRLRQQFAQLGRSEAEAAEAVADVLALENWLSARGRAPEDARAEDLRPYVRALIEKKRNAPQRLENLASYFYMMRRNESYIYLCLLTGGIGVIESILSRCRALAGDQAADKIAQGAPLPPVGTDPEELPAFTARFVALLTDTLPEPLARSVLAGNNHGIPAAAFNPERERYLAAPSLDVYLKEKHARAVETLQRHCDSGEVWFEQVVSQAFVDYVASNQELLSARHEDGKLYVTKVPYAPDSFLSETDPVKKRYHACHCPFARESILHKEQDVPATWCYCSGGFAKHPYETIFGRPLSVELLQSVLRGDPVCRFAIHLDDAEQP